VGERSAWPGSTWIVGRSGPASSKCVAYECRSVCGLTRRSMPAACAAKRTASQITLGVIAIVLATVNMVGGFVVTDRMLEMFRGKRPEKKPAAAEPDA